MLDLTIKPKEFYDEESNTFFVPECVAKDVHLRLEHSLVSISKWESYLSVDDINKVNSYIEDPMSATTINENRTYHVNREQPTSELIYYWMIALNIPMECQKWHLNRLLNLVRICNIKNAPPKKMSQRDIIARNKALNAERRAKYNTKG